MAENKISITTDSGCDMPQEFFERYNLPRVKISYICGDEVLSDNGIASETDAFYAKQAAGVTCSTTGVNTAHAEAFFNEQLAAGLPIVHISFAGALSVTCSVMVVAAEQIKADNPKADITVLDGHAASAGQAKLLIDLLEQRDAGASKEEAIDWFEDNYLKYHHFYTVSELKSLQKSGRVKAATAFWGDILSINPLMTVDTEGRLIPYKKEHGRKKVLKAMIAEMQERVENPEKQIILINHGQCLEDAEALKTMILENFTVKDVIINRIGPVIGCHTGPTVLALFFKGKKRDF